MTEPISRRTLLVGGGGGVLATLAGCSENGDDGHTTYDIENQRSDPVTVDFRMFYMGELVIAREYDLDAGERRREENALAGTEFEVDITVDGEDATYSLEPNDCDNQELRIRIQEDGIEFGSDDCS